MAGRGRRDTPKDGAVLNLQLDSTSAGLEPRDVTDEPAVAFKMPCTLKGLSAGASGGGLGFVFGFGGYWLSQRLKGTFKASLAEGYGSAKTFAVMGALYAAVGCFCQRLRQKEDAWNTAASGCATGLVLGWSSGPVAALGNCAMLGAFSYFADGMGRVPAAAASTGHTAWAHSEEERRLVDFMSGRPGAEVHGAPALLRRLLSPALPLAAALAPCLPAFGGCPI